jgi:hypothetical protein
MGRTTISTAMRMTVAWVREIRRRTAENTANERTSAWRIADLPPSNAPLRNSAEVIALKPRSATVLLG